MKTHKTSTIEIFTPGLDPVTMGEFKGNHYDLWINFNRKGDELLITTCTIKGHNGMFLNRKEEKFSINEMVSGLKKSAQEMGLKFECIDNLPEGLSIPKSSFA